MSAAGGTSSCPVPLVRSGGQMLAAAVASQIDVTAIKRTGSAISLHLHLLRLTGFQSEHRSAMSSTQPPSGYPPQIPALGLDAVAPPGLES
jgi:hypothetical protein